MSMAHGHARSLSASLGYLLDAGDGPVLYFGDGSCESHGNRIAARTNGVSAVSFGVGVPAIMRRVVAVVVVLAVAVAVVASVPALFYHHWSSIGE